MPLRIIAAEALFLSAAAAAAFAYAPVASADDPPPTEPTQQQAPVDPAGIAGSAVDRVAQQLPPASPYPTSGPPGGVCMRMNGFPIYIPPGGIPSEMASSGVPSGPVHAGNCTSEDGPIGAATDAAGDVVNAAVPPSQTPAPAPNP